MLGFIQWILIYTLLEGAILIALVSVSKRKSKATEEKISMRISLALAVGLITYIVPQGLKLLLAEFSYPNPDTYNYVLSVEKLMPWSKMPIDPYYRGFPVYIIWGDVLSLVLGTNGHNAFAILHIASSLLIPVLMLIMTRTFDPQIHKSLFPLLYPLIPITSIYLYSYTMIMIPQSVGISVLLLMLTLVFKHMRRMEYLLVYTMLIPISLVHFTVVPTYIFILTTFVILKIVAQRSAMPTRNIIALLSVPPLLLHLIYSTYAYSANNLKQYIEYYIQLWVYMLMRPERVFDSMATTAVAGFSRRYPYINALGPALFLSLMLAGAYTILKRLVQFNAAPLSTAIIGIIYLTLGVSRLYFAVWIPSASIARYVNVYGFLLISIFNTYILAQLLDREDRCVNIALAIMFALGFIGAILDPFTFQQGFTHTEALIRIATLLPENVMVNFVSGKDLYYIGPAISMWLQLNDKNVSIILLNNSQLNIDALDKVFSSEFIKILQGHEEMSVILLGEVEL